MSAPIASAPRARIEAVDILRGVIMILMAIDHVRDFLGAGGNPVNLATTTVPLFFTRWVTHFCAPVFCLLTGTGAYLSLRRKSKPELSRFLFTRGLWLIFLELVVSRVVGWQFNFDYHVTMLVVLWSLGWGMIVLAGLVFLPTWLVAAFGGLMILTHNLFDSVPFSNPVWNILHVPGFILNTPQHTIFVVYPLIPWVGVMAAGYSLGYVYGLPSARRKTWLLRVGIALTVAFVLLRATNVYGDPAPWAPQKTIAFTVLSFLNTTKYPPSLLFLLMTLGPVLIFLSVLDDQIPRWLRPALVFGKVPMFYYLLHIPLIHLIAIAICFARYGHIYWMFESPTPAQFPVTPPPGWGYSLPFVYLIWGVVVLMLYPLCQWFAGVRRRRSDPWLSYF
jgi:uncharacterized membrane protein